MIDPKKYVEFVDAVTSQPSKSYTDFAARLYELEEQKFHSERLLTASVGMCAEAGEFTEENLFHLKRELGDIMWYVAQACMGLDISLDEVLAMNVEKLSARYPDGAFDVHFSENRKEGDV
jgi:NTP pyrophosphatase (non-canonical NTP hydrolase)